MPATPPSKHDPGLASEAGFAALADALRRHGVGASRTAIGPSGLPEGPAVDVDVVVVDSYEHRADAVLRDDT